MKKLIVSIALSAMLAFTAASTVLAAPSVTTTTTTTTTTTSETATNEAKSLAAGVSAANTVMIDGKEVTVTPVIAAVAPETVTSAKTAASLVSANATVLKVVDVSLPENFSKATLTFNISGIVAGENVTVLHQKKDGTWEKISADKVGTGTVTATFTSLSPVAFVVDGTSAKTGESGIPFLPVLGAVCLAGAIFCGAKFRIAK